MTDAWETAELGDYVVEFSQSTMENWQSEFLQLFSFVLLSALLIHRGSGESRDSDERIEQALGSNRNSARGSARWSGISGRSRRILVGAPRRMPPGPSGPGSLRLPATPSSGAR